MNRTLLGVVAALLLSSCGGEPASAPTEGAPAEQADLYTCGMHPEVVQRGPGSCPICGMDLVPLNVAPDASVVLIDPTVVQNMGVRLSKARIGPIFRHVRTLGEIEVAEDEISVVNLRYSGWIERIRVDETGAEVRKGQTLFDIYSPEVVAAQDELLLALRTEGEDGPRVRAVKTRLRRLVHSRTAVHVQRLARDLARIVRNQEGYRLPYVLRCLRPAERHPQPHVPVEPERHPHPAAC